MTISGDTVGTAGDELQLICTVTTVDNLVESALFTVQWSGDSVGSDEVTEDNTTNSGVSTLTFNPLLTSHGAQYTCQAMINISSINVMVTGSNSIDIMVQSKLIKTHKDNNDDISPVPSPVVMVSVMESMLVSGSSLSLICSIQPTSVTTATTVIFSWNAPNNGTINAVNETSVELMISSVVTADSGEYICSATLTDSSNSMYVIDSEPATATAIVIVSKCSCHLWLRH